MDAAALDKILSGEGWSALNAIGEQPTPDPAAVEADFQLSRSIAATFGSGTGALVLAWLRERTIEQPAFNPDAGPMAASQGFFREGQNSIYREIVRRIAEAREGPPSAARKSRRKKEDPDA
jgi:hypothetical protein